MYVCVCVCVHLCVVRDVCVCVKERLGVGDRLKANCNICNCLLWCQLLVETGSEGGVGGSDAFQLVQMVQSSAS